MGVVSGEGTVPVPGREASNNEVVSFAATYNGYDVFAADPDSLERVLWPIYEEIERSSAVPEWIRLDLARALLFFAYRRDYFGGGYGPYEPMRALIDQIRLLSGGWVENRSAPLQHETEPGDFGSATIGEFEDTWEYSSDGLYRWWYERRWEPGPTMCFVGLNPSTGDTDGKHRPTLGRVVGWARREGCGAVVVVNLFAFRATKPAELFAATVDIVGDRNTEVTRQRSAASSVTLAAWGGHPMAQKRAIEVAPLLSNPQCVGTTKSGAPRHPLYIPAMQALEPFPRPEA
jgi:hypothetical protein